MKKLNILGEFWLPAEPDNRATGILSFAPDEGARLVLAKEGIRSKNDSALWQFPGNSLTNLEDVPRIDGLGIYDIESRQASSHHFTLQDCSPRGNSIHAGSAKSSTSTFQPSFIYDGGVRWEHEEDIVFSSVSFTIQGTEGWISSIIQTDKDFEWDEEEGKNRISKQMLSVSINDSDDEQAYIDGIGRLTVWPGIASHSESFSHAIDASHGFKIEFERPKNFDEILKLASRIQDLIVVATDETHLFDDFSLTVFELEDIHITGYFQEAFVTEKDTLQKKSATQRYHDSRFRYEEIGRARGIAQWVSKTISTSDIDWTLAVAHITEPEKWSNTPIEARLLFVLNGVLMLYPEDITGKNILEKQNITRRLNKIIEIIDDVLPDYIDETWAEAVCFLRNKCIAHPEARREFPFPESGGSTLHITQQLLYRVGISYIMKFVLELSDNHIKNRVWNNYRTQQILDQMQIHNIKKWHESVITKSD